MPSRHSIQLIVCCKENIDFRVFSTGDMKRIVGFKSHAFQFLSPLNQCVTEWNEPTCSLQYLLEPIPPVSIGNGVHFMGHDSAGDPLPLSGLTMLQD